jgi:hypothetical protein
MSIGTALIRRPGPALAGGIVTHRDRVPVDVGLDERQWEAYVRAMADNGWHLVEVPPAGADARQPEVDGVAESHRPSPRPRTLAHRNGSCPDLRQRSSPVPDHEPDQQRLHLDRRNRRATIRVDLDPGQRSIGNAPVA